MRRKARKIIFILGLLLLLIAAVVLCYRFWLGYALRPAAQQYGVHFEKFERLGHGRFALTQVVRTNALFDLSISRVEGFYPDVWYRKLKGTNTGPEFVQINGWKLVIHTNALAKNPPASVQTNRTPYAEFKLAEHYLDEIKQWLPSATLLNGTIDYARKRYSFPQITWKDGNLDAGGIWPVTFVPFDLKGKLGSGKPYQLYYSMTPLDLGVKLQLWETNDLLALKLNGSYQQSTLFGTAEFSHDAKLPNKATLSAPDFHIAAEQLKLRGYNEFTGSFSAKWQTNRFSVQLNAHADPFSGSKLPPADIEFSARGDTNQFTIEKASSTAPGIQLSISDPLQANFKGELLSDHSVVTVNADLEKIPWLKLKGHVEGKITLERGGKLPLAHFDLQGKNIVGYNLQLQAADLKGTLNWPRLDQFSANLQFQSNSIVRLAGGANLQTRELDPSTFTISGQMATNLLPAGFSYSSVQLTATASGPITNLTHSAQLELRDFIAPQIRRMNIAASWSGVQFLLDQFKFRATAGPAVLYASGGGSLRRGKTNVIFRELTLSKGDQLYLTLAKPFRVSLFGKAFSNEVARVLQVEPLTWQGEGKQLSLSAELSWPHAGSIDFAATNINPELFQFFVHRSLRGLELPQLAGNFHWNDSPLYGALRGGLSFEQDLLKRVFAQAVLELDQSGLTLSDFSLRDTNGVIAHAQGFLPLSIRPLEPGRRIQLSQKETVDFKAETAPNQEFWDHLTNIAKVKVTNAAMVLELHGAIQNPTGVLKFTANTVEPLQSKRPLPQIGPVQLSLSLNEQSLNISQASFEMAQQPFTVTGRVQLGTNFWNLRRAEIIPFLQENAVLAIRAPEVQIAPLAPYISKFLAPSGVLNVDAGIAQGRKMTGTITLTGVETRPIPKVGVIQSIGATVNLNGTRIELANLQGAIGGETLTIRGDLDIARSNLNLGYPRVNLTIQGRNIPLARNPDIILRSDLDLTVRNGTNMIPLIAGAANLRDSFLLRDIQTLAPGRVTKPSRRPPYFSIEQEPIDEWTLNVRVRGDNFLRVRSPFFQGEVSLAMNVTGTLREPLAVGEANISSGKIIFPFAPLDVKQAIVSLSSEDPYRPKIFAIANGRAFGYDIKMQADGPADAPNIQFSSVPALTSEQIVLMLTTGQIPRSDFGFSNQEKASKLAFFLGKSLLSKLIPGQPSQERLVIRSGEDITEQGRQTYSVEYKINDKWSLVGEYDRFGALNADVKWKLFSK